MSSKPLVENLEFWRSERPDEWTMDELIRDAKKMTAELEQLRAEKAATPPLDFDLIEDNFPDGGFTDKDGYTCVSAQWLHDFANNIAKAASAASAKPVTTLTPTEKAQIISTAQVDTDEWAEGLSEEPTLADVKAYMFDLIAEKIGGEPMPRLPATPEEVLSFIGPHFDSHKYAGTIMDHRFTLSVHDLLSAFRDWEPVEQEPVGMVVNSSFAAHKVLVATTPLDDIPLGAKLLLASPQAPVAAVQGYKLVPLEPTPEMIAAAMAGATYDPKFAGMFISGLMSNYRKMLAAAPDA